MRLPSGAVRVTLRGELDLTRAYTLEEELRAVEQRRPPCIVVDLRELSFISACGVSRLVAARQRARRAGRRLVVVRGRAIQRLLTLTALEQTFEVVSDVPSRLREPPLLAARTAAAPASCRSRGGGASAPNRLPSQRAKR